MGVGGRTIAEAKRNINIREYQVWLSYLRKKGMLKPIDESVDLSDQEKRILETIANVVVR